MTFVCCNIYVGVDKARQRCPLYVGKHSANPLNFFFSDSYVKRKKKGCLTYAVGWCLIWTALMSKSQHLHCPALFRSLVAPRHMHFARHERDVGKLAQTTSCDEKARVLGTLQLPFPQENAQKWKHFVHAGEGRSLDVQNHCLQTVLG